MNFITTMCVAVFAYYFLYLFMLIVSPRKRREIETKNEKLEKMRTVPMKTLEEQKEFINIKYPKSYKIEWTKIIVNIVIFLIIFSLIRLVFVNFGLNFTWLEGLIIIAIIIIGISIILRPFRLQNNDIEMLLKW